MFGDDMSTKFCLLVQKSMVFKAYFNLNQLCMFLGSNLCIFTINEYRNLEYLE